MPEATFLSRYVNVRGRFVRSVHIERDFREADDRSYYLTETACYVMQAVAKAFNDPAGRAMTLIGPYGAGKSAFCVHLARTLEHGSATDTSLSGKRLLPVLVVGSREALGTALIRGLRRALSENGYAAVLRDLQPRFEDLERRRPTPREVADLYSEAARQAHSAGNGGLLLIIDEMGKFLEYAALRPSDGDIFGLQELAEAACRSETAPLLVVGVLHQNADAYAQKLGRAHQAEWAKVGERFRQVPFYPSDVERTDMVARALVRGAELRLNGHMSYLSRACRDLKLPPVSLADRFDTIADESYPLHPVVLLALPILFRRTGQSHRSMFNFLAGEETHALGRFLRETEYVAQTPPLYMLDNLFDYAAEVLMGGWSASGVARLWAEAVESVDRAVNLSDQARRTLKCIALLGILKDVRLTATRNTLELAMTGCDGVTPDIEAALAELQQRRLITLSRARGTYRLWEGGDVDVEAELSNARRTVPTGAVLQVASSLSPLPRLTARRHSYETGTLRVVETRVCTVANMAKTIEDSGSELAVIYCLAANAEEVETAERHAKRITSSNLLVAVTAETDALRDAAMDIAAAERVAKETPALKNDRAARRELAARRGESESAFREEWDRLFGAGQGLATWYWRGTPITLESARSFSSLLTEIANATYRFSPCLRNELINRHNISSAAAAGRRNLIDKMLAERNTPRLGIKSFPPELSMYECLLRATGLHREIEPGQWAFCGPDEADAGKLKPCWDALEAAFFSSPPAPRSVKKLFETLQAPPYGLTEGVMPVLLCAFMLAHPDETTLYRDGVFVPEVTVADWEVLMRRPELFAVAGCRVQGERAAVVERLARGLNTRAAVLPVVRALLNMVKSLPEFAWKTRQLPEQVIAMREAFNKAQSPERLLFHDLPLALGLTLSAKDRVEASNVEEFFSALKSALNEWGAVFQRVTGLTRDVLLLACNLPNGDEGWAQLRGKAAEIKDEVTDPRLCPFISRATMSADHRTALDSALALLANRPPITWTDADAERALAEARIVGALFTRAVTDHAHRVEDILSAAEAEQSSRVARRVRAAIGAQPRRIQRAALLALLEELED